MELMGKVSFLVLTIVLMGGHGSCEEDWTSDLLNEIGDAVREGTNYLEGEAEKYLEAGKSVQVKGEEWGRLLEKKLRDEGERVKWRRSPDGRRNRWSEGEAEVGGRREKRSLWVEQLKREWEARERQRAEEETAEASRLADEERRQWEEARSREEDEGARRRSSEQLEETRGYQSWQRSDENRRRQVSGVAGGPYSGGSAYSSAPVFSSPRDTGIWGQGGGEGGGFNPEQIPQVYSPNQRPQGFFTDRRGEQDYFPANRERYSGGGSSSEFSDEGYFQSNLASGKPQQPSTRPGNFPRIPIGQSPLNIRGGVRNEDVSWLAQRDKEEAALANQRALEERMEEERRRKEAEREAEEERDEIEAREIERRYQERN